MSHEIIAKQQIDKENFDKKVKQQLTHIGHKFVYEQRGEGRLLVPGAIVVAGFVLLLLGIANPRGDQANTPQQPNTSPATQIQNPDASQGNHQIAADPTPKAIALPATPAPCPQKPITIDFLSRNMDLLARCPSLPLKDIVFHSRTGGSYAAYDSANQGFANQGLGVPSIPIFVPTGTKGAPENTNKNFGCTNVNFSRGVDSLGRPVTVVSIPDSKQCIS